MLPNCVEKCVPFHQGKSRLAHFPCMSFKKKQALYYSNLFEDCAMYLDPRVHPEKLTFWTRKNGAVYIDVSPVPFVSAPIFSFSLPCGGLGRVWSAVSEAGKPGLLPLLLPLPRESHRLDLQMSDLRSGDRCRALGFLGHGGYLCWGWSSPTFSGESL